MECLNLQQSIWDLDLDIQGFAVVGDRMFLMGYDDPDGGDRPPPDDATWNLVVEIMLE